MSAKLTISNLVKENAALKAEIKKLHKQYSEALKSMEQSMRKRQDSMGEAYDIINAFSSVNDWGKRWMQK
jgi:regulator of replication initiation timing